MMPERNFYQPAVFLFWTVLSQIIAVSAFLLISEGGASREVAFCVGACLAFLFARYLGLSLSWQILNFLLPFTVLLSLGSFFPAWVPGIILFTLLMIYIPAFWTRVPFYPTSREMYVAIAERLPDDRPFKFIDLGCGFGSLLVYLSRNKKQGYKS